MRGASLRSGCSIWLMAASGFAAAPSAAAEIAAAIAAQPPSELAVTVYRAPARSSGSIDLNRLNGFALISETRTVRLPEGLSRLRFEGVADGIEPASAILSGLAEGIIEKNRDAGLLSPSALMAAAVGKSVVLLRTDKRTGKTQQLNGTILSDAGGGVVFQTTEGTEALRCSGLPETFSFSGAGELSAQPTLSVLVRSPKAMTAVVTLSYLARGFDWAADYIATLSADGTTMDLGAWVTLANGNGVGFPTAHTQVVAGRVNRESGVVEPIAAAGPILAQCWPRGSTSDPPGYLRFDRASPLGAANDATVSMQAMASAAPRLEGVTLTAQKVEQEQLGDLKLYRIPNRTTVASRQSKQVRLLDQQAVPISRVYSADITGDEAESTPAFALLRTMNNSANHLGLPLPSGKMAVFATRRGMRLLEHEADIRDLAVDEEVEINMGAAPDVEVTVTKDNSVTDSASPDAGRRVEISNAGDAEIRFELRLRLRDGTRLVRADPAIGTKGGRPIFRLTIPAHGAATVRYQTRRHG